ncbi:MAG: alpha/beta fold hydrolase [Rhodoglobus sp.]
MELHVREWGQGDRVAILLHGMMGSSESWWRVTPALVDRGYRVIAMDLPGHGHSPRDPSLTIERAASAVVATAAARGCSAPALAIGHSFGGLVLAAALPELHPNHAVLVDAPTSSRGGWDRDEVRAEYEEDRKARTIAGLIRTHPHYNEQDARVEADAARLFDPDTASASASAPGGSWPPPAGTIVIRAMPSSYVSDEAAATMRSNGVIVHDLPGALHSVWYSHFDEFLALIPSSQA